MMTKKFLLAVVCALFALTLNAQTTPATAPEQQSPATQPAQAPQPAQPAAPAQTVPPAQVPETAQPAQTPQPAPMPEPAPPAQPAQAAQPAQPAQAATGQAAATTGNQIPAGTQLQIRTNQAITATSADVGQQYSAEIAENVMDAAGNILIPKGSQAQLTIAKVGKTQPGVGSNQVALALQSVNIAGRTYTVQTNQVNQAGDRGIGKNKRTAEMTGGGALLGTVIGAVAGGAKGAVIGAVVGGAGGAAAQVLTQGDQVKVPAETLLTFKLDQPLVLQQQ